MLTTEAPEGTGIKVEPQSYRTSSPSISSFQGHQRREFSSDVRVCRLQASHSQVETTGHTSCYTALAPPGMPFLKVTNYLPFNYPLNPYFRRRSPGESSTWLKITQPMHLKAEKTTCFTPGSFPIFCTGPRVVHFAFAFLL